MALRPPRTSTPGGAHAPVVFAGQPRYFRAAWEDAVHEGWGHVHPIVFGGKDPWKRLAATVEAAGARTCVVFEPWMLAARPAAFAAVRALGVRMVAYSTEPLPHDGEAAPHPDVVRRLGTLRGARAVPWDLVVHHDPSSAGVLAAEGFAPVAFHPLPVSTRLFFPEDVPRDLDVAFLGRTTPHRDAFLAPLRARFRLVHPADGCFDEDARRLMNRARVVVNLHAHAFPNFETRAVQALRCGRPLVSEPLSGGFLTPGVEYTVARTPDEMVACVADLLAGAEPEPAPTGPPARFHVASLRALVTQAASAPEAP